MKIRVVVEYDPDAEEGANPVQVLQAEHAAWQNGDVTFQDLHYLQSSGDAIGDDIVIRIESVE